MAVLETIRNKFGILITVLIAVALLSFIIDPTSLSSLTGDQMVGEDTEVASINGKSVTYTELNNEVRKYNDFYPFNITDTLTPIDVQKQQYNDWILNKAMNNFLMENLYVVNAKKAGFNVSEEEMYQILSGQMYSNVIMQEFRGQMTPDFLIELENNASKDASGVTQMWWDNIKKTAEYDRYVTKYFGLFARSYASNSLLDEEDIKNGNNIFDVEFVLVPYSSDDTVEVSAAEIEKYYNANKNRFSQPETRSIEYVVVDFNAENEDEVFAQVESVFNNVKIENFSKVAVDNGFSYDTIEKLYMGQTNFGAVANVENIVKWAYKEDKAGAVSDIYTIENDGASYFVIAALNKITPEGPASLEQVKSFIESTLIAEKQADKQLAEVKAKVNGMTDLNEIAKALGTTVSTKEKLTFASSDLVASRDFDQKFTGAASVAQEGVVSAPFKGENGIYVYKVTNRSEEAFFKEEDANKRFMYFSDAYSQMLQYVLNKEGKVKDYTYLYF